MAVARVFFEVSMGLGPVGLAKYLKEKKVKPGPNEYIMFVNKKETKVKILLNSERLFYLRKDSKITMDELMRIPQYFKGEWIGSSVAGSLNQVFMAKKAQVRSA